MIKRIILFTLILSFALSAHAAIWYLRVPIEQVDAYMARLDALKGSSPYTLHYTQPVFSPMATVTTALLPIDERAQALLTPEEWASKLDQMPAEFQRSINP